MQVNYHALADFRSQSGEALDGLLSANIASLIDAGVVKLKRVAQDGMRVRASAGAASFRRKEKLEGYLDAAQKRVETLKAKLDEDPGAESRRSKAAQERAAREQKARIEAALERLPELAGIKKRQGKPAEDARSSTTDADATVMKMGDGGYRPAYNVQFGSDADSRVIAPVPQPKTPRQDKPVAGEQKNAEAAPDAVESASPVDRYQRKPGDSEAVGDWRERMRGDEMKALYKERASVAECVNAQARNRNLVLLPLRGLKKVKAVVCLYALAHNLMRMFSQAPELLGIGTGTSEIQTMTA